MALLSPVTSEHQAAENRRRDGTSIQMRMLRTSTEKSRDRCEEEYYAMSGSQRNQYQGGEMKHESSVYFKHALFPAHPLSAGKREILKGRANLYQTYSAAYLLPYCPFTQ
ncbi:hypothetical protein AVEN_85162-1 [Araneus ventricosus]|uniref:Uncharacterized protein n=1 Tax=Araneus ventricosus TaxID=182803 RepID=A0A4Y2LIS9_ARAVE|nr:hypothetical protein AVEN_85162-1 [Araneus ventricosus]